MCGSKTRTGGERLTLNVRDPSDLVDLAVKANSDELVQAIKGAVQLLSTETGQIGDLRITGRLISVPPKGEIIIVGDIHGDLKSLVHVLKNSSFIEKTGRGEDFLLVFLGDYGDRGFYSAEVYYVILKLKRMFPQKVVLMRGNHEGPRDLLAYPHDLPTHINRKFGEAGANVYAKLRELFDQLYNAVIVEDRYVLLHGGVPSKASTIDDLAYAHEKHPRETHLEEILWSDPNDAIKGTYPSPRGAGRLFGKDVTEKLLKMLNVKVLIRGHEPSGEGFKTNHNGKVLTLFSRRGSPYNNKHGAYLQLNASEKPKNAKQLQPYIHKF
ncbi:serine/threonine protein phosphatase [Candidatus Bathyarchaeota archaeon]|nr:serine/threonine protein phosphatase [Candidatus Bathyarchaeota archaeon]